MLDGQPFPALAEEDTREAGGYNAQKDSVTAGMQSNYSAETAREHADDDRSHQPKRTSSGHVRPPTPSAEPNVLMLK